MTDRPVLVPDAGHPITIAPTGERVVVRVGDTVVADTTEALSLAEASYPVVQYVPMADVDASSLVRSDHTTYCPFKGEASYYSLTVGGETLRDVVWTYEAPYDAVEPIAGHLAFYADRTEVSVG